MYAMYVCFFVFVFLGLFGLVNLLVLFCQYAFVDGKHPPVVISPKRNTRDVEFRVRSALIKNNGYVVINLNNGCLEDSELLQICTMLAEDNPRVKLCKRDSLQNVLAKLE